MQIQTTASDERVVTIRTTLPELKDLHLALIRKKRTKGDIKLLHSLARALSQSEPDLPGVAAS